MDEVQTSTAYPPHNGKQLLYFRMKYRLTITVPTHKCHKRSFKHSKTSYVVTSGRVIFTIQIHSRKEFLKGLKWPLQNGPFNTGEQQDFHYPAARFNEEECLPVWGGDALSGVNLSWTHPINMHKIQCFFKQARKEIWLPLMGLSGQWYLTHPHYTLLSISCLWVWVRNNMLTILNVVYSSRGPHTKVRYLVWHSNAK
jgi:hypothetical protein